MLLSLPGALLTLAPPPWGGWDCRSLFLQDTFSNSLNTANQEGSTFEAWQWGGVEGKDGDSLLV